MNCMNKMNEDRETFEILSDIELVQSLKRAEEDIKAGRLHSHEEVFGIRQKHNG